MAHSSSLLVADETTVATTGEALLGGGGAAEVTAVAATPDTAGLPSLGNIEGDGSPGVGLPSERKQTVFSKRARSKAK